MGFCCNFGRAVARTAEVCLGTYAYKLFLSIDFNYDSEYHYLPELQCSSKGSEESSEALGACAAVEESMHVCCGISCMLNLLFVLFM